MPIGPMNILFLTQVLPFPLDAGPKVRAYYVLRHLAESGHRLTLLSFTRESDRPEHLEHLRTFCAAIHTVPMRRSKIRDAWTLVRTLASRNPFLIARDWVPSMAREAAKLAGSLPAFDAVHADQLWMAPYALLARNASPGRPLAVLDQHNAVFNIPRRLAETGRQPWMRGLLRIEAGKLARYETDLLGKFDRVVWVTDEDRQALAHRSDSGTLPGVHTIIPIALDVSARSPLPRGAGIRRVTFMGGLHWPPNAEGIRWFRREIWPRIRSRVPGAVLTIIGRDSGRHSAAPPDPAVEIAGYVADPAPYLAETAVFIVPLLAGGGMRVKILDAWSLGLPVVSTPIGAEGIQARDGENLFLADEPDSFASAVVRIMDKPEIAERLSRGGRETVESRYDSRKVYQAWDQIYPCTSCTSFLMRPA